MPRPAMTVLSVALTAVLAAAASVAMVAYAANPAVAASSAHDPQGAVDVWTHSGAAVSFRGWAADPDQSGVVRMVVKVDKTVISSMLAIAPRPDVAKAHPSFGAKRGFSGSLNLPAGAHTVCLVAGDLGAGANVELGCKTMTAPKGAAAATSSEATRRPFGLLDGFVYSATKQNIWVHGWALDPDTVSSIVVEVTIAGQAQGSVIAARSRPDVEARHPGRGANHGFDYTMQTRLDAGTYSVCAVGINSAAGGNAILSCKNLTVKQTAPPAALNVATTATAAAAIRAQAINSGAARTSHFPAGASSAATIALATRALLQQAAGRSTRPPARPGVPGFAAAGPSKVVDEQAVMGPRPALGSYAAVKKGGRGGIARSLQLYANDALATPGARGVGLAGAARVLPANGRTVHPTLPAYPAHYTRLRAEVAIDAALVHIGDPYVWAAAGPTTFDCSGLTQWAWAKAGVRLTHYTNTQAVQGVRVQANQLLPGDLVLFGKDLHHVGTYLGAGYMLDAPNTGAYVRVDKISWFGDFSLAVRP
jgi:cell wall-associated NlpC family hydrolase